MTNSKRTFLRVLSAWKSHCDRFDNGDVLFVFIGSYQFSTPFHDTSAPDLHRTRTKKVRQRSYVTTKKSNDTLVSLPSRERSRCNVVQFIKRSNATVKFRTSFLSGECWPLNDWRKTFQIKKTERKKCMQIEWNLIDEINYVRSWLCVHSTCTHRSVNGAVRRTTDDTFAWARCARMSASSNTHTIVSSVGTIRLVPTASNWIVAGKQNRRMLDTPNLPNDFIVFIDAVTESFPRRHSLITIDAKFLQTIDSAPSALITFSPSFCLLSEQISIPFVYSHESTRTRRCALNCRYKFSIEFCYFLKFRLSRSAKTKSVRIHW